MTSQIEIEFKTHLTKEEFLHCQEMMQLHHAVTQKNDYFDDKKQTLKHHHAALRIRKIDDYCEMTLKTKADTGHLETTESLNDDEYAQFLMNGILPYKKSIDDKLKTMHSDLAQMHQLASLTTTRFEKQLNDNCTIMLDESFYYGQTDYELEMEVIDVNKGQAQFLQLLNDLGLSYQPSCPKILRAIQAKQQAK